jgi:hypothetical protein
VAVCGGLLSLAENLRAQIIHQATHIRSNMGYATMPEVCHLGTKVSLLRLSADNMLRRPVRQILSLPLSVILSSLHVG